MGFEQLKTIAIIATLTLVSGIADSQGFVHAAQMWHKGQIVWAAFGKSALGFGIGLTAYWFVIKYLQALGVFAPEAQALLWFTVAIIGVALVSRKFFGWQLVDQLVALGVVAGLGWLLFRTGG